MSSFFSASFDDGVGGSGFDFFSQNSQSSSQEVKRRSSGVEGEASPFSSSPLSGSSKTKSAGGSIEGLLATSISQLKKSINDNPKQLSFFGHPIGQINLCGWVQQRKRYASQLTFTLCDGTGKIEVSYGLSSDDGGSDDDDDSCDNNENYNKDNITTDEKLERKAAEVTDDKSSEWKATPATACVKVGELIRVIGVGVKSREKGVYVEASFIRKVSDFREYAYFHAAEICYCAFQMLGADTPIKNCRIDQKNEPTSDNFGISPGVEERKVTTVKEEVEGNQASEMNSCPSFSSNVETKVPDHVNDVECDKKRNIEDQLRSVNLPRNFKHVEATDERYILKLLILEGDTAHKRTLLGKLTPELMSTDTLEEALTKLENDGDLIVQDDEVYLQG